jgi:hypothetical protein
MRVGRKRVLRQVLRGTAEANIRFRDLRSLLIALGFVERAKVITFLPNLMSWRILNLQPHGSLAKPFRVKQVRAVILRHRLAERV